MQTQTKGSPARPANLQPNSSGLLILTGYGLRISVERSHLCLADGVGSERRQGRLARATCRLKRLVVLGHSGFVTLEALRWIQKIGASFVQVDADGQLVAVSCSEHLDDPRL